MQLIIGLGNPGTRYVRTRHNIGFWVIDMLSERWSIPLTKHKFKSDYGEGLFNGQKIILLKPQTFMNRSGEAVADVVNYYNIDQDSILVIYDDLALEPSYIRARSRGSAGGHNGMRNIIKHLGSDDFPRIRIGIGSPPAYLNSADYVLQGIDGSELRILQEAAGVGADAAEVWMQEGINKVMNLYNRKQAISEE